jgi:hypothetical protein
MKKIFTLFTALFFVGSIYSQVSFCDDLESYQNGDPIAETSPNWNTWGELMTGTIAPFVDDASVSNTVASSGTNSLYFLANPGPGPQDILLMFDTTSNINQSNLGSLATPYVSGNFTFSQQMNVRYGAYLNFQSENIPGQVWSLEVNFDIDPVTQNGTISMSNTTYNVPFIGIFHPSTWFEFRFEIDLSNNIWELFIDGVSQGSFPNTINQIASLDLYTRAGDEYSVDDICYDYIPATLAPINAQTYIISPITGLVGQQRYPSVEVRNFGINTINSFDITFDYNGSQITENITNINGGLGMNSMQTTVVNFTNPIILASGTTTGTAYIYNINNGTTQSTTDDTLTISIDAVTPAAGKLVLGEEATGTWCGWCPRGAVALNWMDNDYEGYWQGIAVHNGDPMTDADYDNGIAPYIGGYPSGIVDRGQEINPAAFKQDFLQRIVVDPNGIITNGAELIGDTLKVNLTVNFQNSVSGNYKLACVLVEDSVTGTTPQYYQSNSYSGGSAGPLIDVDGSDWANKPSSVPASQMVYRHVARGIAPNFNGSPLASTSYNSGDTETLCFEFILDASWDLSQIHIVGMLIDNGNMIDNASTSTINNAINNGYTSCTATSIGLELNGPDKVNIYPNPATDNIYISNLIEKSSIKIYDIQGKLVLENKISNKEYVNISILAKGIYQVKFEGNNLNETRKLIIE